MNNFQKIYLSWKGRICRKTYWIFSIPLVIIYIPLYLYDEIFNIYVYLLLTILIVYPSMMINIKRAHDRNRTGWFSLLLLFPIISFWPLIEFGFLKGDETENKYGEPDKTWET